MEAEPSTRESAQQQAWETSANSALAELAAALISAADLEEVSRLVLDHAKRLTRSPLGFVGYLDPRSGHLVSTTLTRDAWDACQVPDKDYRFAKFGGLWGWVLQKRQPVLANVVPADPRSTGTPPGHITIRSFLGVPALVGEELQGVVALANSDRDYSERDLRAVERLAAVYALAARRHHDQDALRRERDFSNAVLDTVANLVVVLDRGGRIVRFNRACERTTGYTFHEVEGKELWDFFLIPGEAAGVKAVFANLVAGQFPQNHENHWITKDGRLRRIAWSNTALVDVRGEVTHVVAAGLDVTEQREAEERLQLYRLLATHARDIVLLLTPEGQVLEANLAALHSYGYTRAELLALNIRDLRAPETTGELAAQLAQAKAGGVLFETVHRRKDGTTFPVEVSSQGADVGGRRVLVSIIRDISERKRAEAERAALLAALQRHDAQLRATFASVADGMVIYDTAGNITTMNEAAAALLGLTSQQAALPLAERSALLGVKTAAGKPVAPEETPAARALRGETVRGQVLVVHTPSRPVWLSISAAPVRAGDQVLGAVSTFSDITALHDMEEQREDYIRAITHDLRNPLTVISGLTELLHRRLQHQGMEREAAMAEKVLRSATRLAGMVSDLLESIRFEAGQIRLALEPTDLGRLAGEVTERLVTPEERARLRVVVPAGLPYILCDAARIERALVNLITNALKYSAAGTPVEIRLDRRGERVLVAVQDAGPGIAADDLPRLFQRFYRGKAGDRVEGTGLGLYIVRLIAEAHGGHVWAESTPGHGSTFFLSLPVKAES